MPSNEGGGNNDEKERGMGNFGDKVFQRAKGTLGDEKRRRSVGDWSKTRGTRKEPLRGEISSGNGEGEWSGVENEEPGLRNRQKSGKGDNKGGSERGFLATKAEPRCGLFGKPAEVLEGEFGTEVGGEVSRGRWSFWERTGIGTRPDMGTRSSYRGMVKSILVGVNFMIGRMGICDGVARWLRGVWGVARWLRGAG